MPIPKPMPEPSNFKYKAEYKPYQAPALLTNNDENLWYPIPKNRHAGHNSHDLIINDLNELNLSSLSSELSASEPETYPEHDTTIQTELNFPLLPNLPFGGAEHKDNGQKGGNFRNHNPFTNSDTINVNSKKDGQMNETLEKLFENEHENLVKAMQGLDDMIKHQIPPVPPAKSHSKPNSYTYMKPNSPNPPKNLPIEPTTMDSTNRANPVVDNPHSFPITKPNSLILSTNAKADGNYKMFIEIIAKVPINFDHNTLKVGKCNSHSPGLLIEGEGNFDVKLTIDLNTCVEEDFNNPMIDYRLVDAYNRAILVSFDLVDPPVVSSPTGHMTILEHYEFNPHPTYSENHIIHYDTDTGSVDEIQISSNGHEIDTSSASLHFVFSPHNIIDKTVDTQSRIRIEPINGFNAEKFINVPELCMISDDSTGESKILWDMSGHTVCQKNLTYEKVTGAWNFDVNFIKDFGFGKHASITCNIRVCGNVEGNDCQKYINDCNYG